MSKAFPGRPRVFRDPIHGDISYSKGPFQKFVESVLDTGMFQRLRSIRQNGVMNLVFHGAEHSRFSHAMGVAHVAGRMFDAITRNTPAEINTGTQEQDREDTVLAALLHDVGHGPFSHSLEEIIRSLGVAFDHERMTERILVESGSQIRERLSEYDLGLPERLVPFISKSKRLTPHWYYSLVSSQLDADRLDYLIRDGHMAGIWSHRFDLGRLIDALGLQNGEIVVDGRARDIVESYLLALDQMYAAAYFHHTNRAASFLVKAIIQRAVDVAKESDPWKEKLFPTRHDIDPLWRVVMEGDKVSLAVYEELDEHHVFSLFAAWRHSGDPTLEELLAKLKRRQFPKPLTVPERMTKREIGQIENDACVKYQAHHSDRSPKYFVGVDTSKRETYKDGRYSEGHAGAIKLLYSQGEAVPIEKEPRSIATLLDGEVIYRYLIVPEEMREEFEPQMRATR